MATYEYDSQNEELHRIAGGTLYADLPIGFILPSFEDVAPVGFLKLTDTLANRTVSRTTYKELFDWATAKGLIGTGKPFGVGDGSTTFVIPDGREIAFKGIGENASGASHVKSGGLAIGEFIDDRVQAHTHTTQSQPTTVGTAYWQNGTGQTISLQTETSSENSGRKGATTEVKALGCHYYIKAKNVGVPADFIKEVSKLNSYSTDEINTGRTWIDGKPIYTRYYPCVINVNIINQSWTNVASCFQNMANDLPTRDTIVDVELNLQKNYRWGLCCFLKDYPATNDFSIFTLVDTTAGANQAFIIMEYTKTTS